MVEGQLSGVAIIICIAIGFTTFVLLFIFGKRQIMRFALKSRRGPHVPIASDAPKSLRKEIERRLDAVKDIKLEPLLMNGNSGDSTSPVLEHIYRMKAVDSLKLLENDISKCGDTSKLRPPGQDLRFFLMRMARDEGPLHNVDHKLLEELAEKYNHARHEALPVFRSNEFQEFMHVLNLIRSKVEFPESNNSSPTHSVQDAELKYRTVQSTATIIGGKNVTKSGGIGTGI